MIRLSALLFVLVFVCRPALPLVVYALNYDYIVKELCINKDNDNLDCRGKCQLKMELANASEPQENNRPASKFKYADAEWLFIEPNRQLLFFESTPSGRHVSDFYLNFYQFQFGTVCEHPPSLA